MEDCLLQRRILQSSYSFLQQVVRGTVQFRVVETTVSFGRLCCIRFMSVTGSTSTSVQAMSVWTATIATLGFPCVAWLARIYLSYHPNQFSNRMLTRCVAPPKHRIRKLRNKKLRHSSYGIQRTY